MTGTYGGCHWHTAESTYYRSLTWNKSDLWRFPVRRDSLEVLNVFPLQQGLGCLRPCGVWSLWNPLCYKGPSLRPAIYSFIRICIARSTNFQAKHTQHTLDTPLSHPFNMKTFVAVLAGLALASPITCQSTCTVDDVIVSMATINRYVSEMQSDVDSTADNIDPSGVRQHFSPQFISFNFKCSTSSTCWQHSSLSTRTSKTLSATLREILPAILPSSPRPKRKREYVAHFQETLALANCTISISLMAFNFTGRIRMVPVESRCTDMWSSISLHWR